MNTKQKLKKYKEYKEKLNAYHLVLATTYFDKETIAPKAGSPYRNKQLAYMSGVTYEIETSKEFIELVNDLSKEDLGELLNRDIALTKKSLENVSKFTKEEIMEYSLAKNESIDAWLKAKATNNYKLFAPHLNKLISLTKYRASKRNPKAIAYNVLLDDYEEGMTIKEYDKFFKLIKKELLPLIKKVNAKQDEIDDSFLYKYYPYAKQKEFNEILLKYINFDKSWGYIGESEHPFTMGIFRNDVRITTNIDEHNITSNIFSVIHEAGHAHYEHNVESKYDGTSIRDISSGMHESQSRFLENYMGRRKSFWVKLYPELQKLFPENLKDVSLDEFYRAINVSKSSLIRTDADELTYPIHILIRYEIEKGIFDGSIDTKNLDKIWKEKYKEYLGIEVPSDTEGILQDIHWSQGSFGYFPTYALGSAFGAQILNTLEKKLDVDKLLSTNKLSTIQKWVKDNVQHDGALHNYEVILQRTTGEAFNPQYYINYLKNKYKNLYKIK